MIDEHHVESVFVIGTVCDEGVGALDLAFPCAIIVEPFLDISDFDRLVNRFSVFRHLVHGPMPAEVLIDF